MLQLGPELVLREPLWLLLLPLALLPWLQRTAATQTASHLAWLPPDPVGTQVERWMRALACLALAAAVLGLAHPERPETVVTRTGRGAEIALLLDRSASMDEGLRHNGRLLGNESRETKAATMRHALQAFVDRRPHDRYALVFFAASPMRVLPFTEDLDAVHAALEAASIGRGLVETDIGRALLAGIEAFDGRPYTGSRVIVLVSDGGAALSLPVQERIRAGLARHHISLYFIYIRSATNSPDLEREDVGPIEASTPEWVLHGWFRTLKTPYRVFQAKDPGSMAAAVESVGRLQNLPLDYPARLPRHDHRPLCFGLAGLLAAVLAAVGGRRLLRAPAAAGLKMDGGPA